MDYREEVNRRLERIRDAQHHARQKRREEIYQLLPRIKEIDGELKQQGVSLAKLVMQGGSVREVQDRIERLTREKKAILVDRRYPEDYLELRYNCDLCKDTGEFRGKMCNCKKNMLISKSYEMSSIEKLLGKENFESFDLRLFRPNRNANEPLSPREWMEHLKNGALKFAEGFSGEDSGNILYYGPVGSGKTFLSNCIAKRILDRGYSVLYQSAPALIAFISEYTFAVSEDKKAWRSKFDFLYDADLLILDDLGTEPMTSMNVSYVFDLLNRRLVAGKSMIVSTNLDLEEIKRTYDNRIFSRVWGNFDVFHVYGDDIRIRKRVL